MRSNVRYRSLLERAAAAPHMVWSILFIVAPLFFVLYFAITDAEGHITLNNLASLTDYSNIFLLSVSFALIATIICLLIGYPLAYFMSRTGKTTRRVLLLLLMLPMWISLLIRTYSLMALLDNGGLLNSLLVSLGFGRIRIIGTGGAVILGMIYDFLPYMVLPIYTVLTKLDPRYIEAAADLGCNSLQVLGKVIIPLSLPGVISGITMVFVPSISTFYISQKLGGGVFDLIGDTIERQFQHPSTYHTGAAISLVMMILIIISVAIMNRFSDSNSGGFVV